MGTRGAVVGQKNSLSQAVIALKSYGQALPEYGFILVFMALACIAFLQIFSPNFSDLLGQLGDKLTP